MQDDAAFLANGQRFITTSSDLNQTVRELVRLSAEAVGSNMGALYLLDEDHQVLKPAVIVNLPDEYVRGCGDIPLGQQCCGRAAMHNIPWFVDDIWNESLFPIKSREGAKRAGIRAGFSVPVAVSGKCVGSLSSHFAEPHVPTDFEIQRHRLFAELIAMALHSESYAADKPASPTNARRLGEELKSTTAAD